MGRILSPVLNREDMGGMNKVGKKKEKEKPLNFVTRLEWGAQPPSEKGTRLKLPVTHVRYAYTGTQPCRKREICDKVLQDYQEEVMDDGLEDVPYNFLVGGDGSIYEGRGWEVEAKRPTRMRSLQGKCIDIAYVGDFEKSIPTPKMIESTERFLKQAIENKQIRDMPQIMSLHDFRSEDNDFGND